MKAKDYVVLYNNYLTKKETIYADEPPDFVPDDLDAMVGVCAALMKEAKQLSGTRKANCVSAWNAIIREQNQKWEAIVRLLGKGDSKLFKLYIAQEYLPFARSLGWA